ncbi:MAG: hypothetical protein KQJ78_04660 [Deltaproteobacteria bacterium]|nr:hypothetical protein [Deltaproteobacteria bacterium]
MKWLASMDNNFFFTVCDVLLDLKEAREKGGNRLTIPLVPMKRRFQELNPATGGGSLEAYGESRSVAAGFLRDVGVIRDLRETRQDHPWGSRLELSVAEPLFPLALTAVKEEYARRAAPPPGQTPAPAAEGLPWGLLHPGLGRVAREPWERGERGRALAAGRDLVLARLAEAVARRGGGRPSGRELIHRALDPPRPLVCLADLGAGPGRLAQEGYRDLFLGLWETLESGLPTAEAELNGRTAAHFLFLLSLCLERLDYAD